MKHRTPQPDFAWDRPEPFALAVETATDGDRIAAAKKKQEADRKEAETKQTELV